MNTIPSWGVLKRTPLVPSYPPFRQWKKRSVENFLQEDALNLYIHIPFCTQRCAFCYFKTVNLRERPEVDSYVDAVCNEIKMVAHRFHLRMRPVASIYFGGGTPTLLRDHHFDKLVTALHDNFRIERPQFTVEAEPLTVSTKKLDTLIRLGVNRLSIGVQSFCDDIIALSGRGHDRATALRAIKLARETGSWSVNIDLLSGLAGETENTWHVTVDRAIATAVESITIYKMEAFANTEFYRDGVRGHTMTLPSHDQELQFMRHAIARLRDANYLPWSFFTFTQEGRYANHYTQEMFRGSDLYGFGVSAYGGLGNTLLQNTSNLAAYISSASAGSLPLARALQLNSLQRMAREVLSELKLMRLNLKAFHERHGIRLQSLCASRLDDLEREGLVTLSGESIDLTAKGLLYGDFVGMTLASHIEQCAGETRIP